MRLLLQLTRLVKTILVTGGAGFIGSNFINYVLENFSYYRVLNLDLLTYCGNLENLKAVEKNPRYSFVRGDICDKRLVHRLFLTYEPDYVVNFAAESHVDRSIEDASPFLRTNIIGTEVLLAAARKF